MTFWLKPNQTELRTPPSVKGCIGKNSSPTWARDKDKIEYISEGQPSSYELAFRVEWDSNPHIKKKAHPILARNKAKIKYINEKQPSPYELTFGVELSPNSHFKMV